MGEKIKYVPYDVVREHLRQKLGQEQKTFYNTETGELEDIHGEPVPTIELTPKQVTELTTVQKRD